MIPLKIFGFLLEPFCAKIDVLLKPGFFGGQDALRHRFGEEVLVNLTELDTPLTMVTFLLLSVLKFVGEIFGLNKIGSEEKDAKLLEQYLFHLFLKKSAFFSIETSRRVSDMINIFMVECSTHFIYKWLLTKQ